MHIQFIKYHIEEPGNSTAVQKIGFLSLAENFETMPASRISYECVRLCDLIQINISYFIYTKSRVGDSVTLAKYILLACIPFSTAFLVKKEKASSSSRKQIEPKAHFFQLKDANKIVLSISSSSSSSRPCPNYIRFSCINFISPFQSIIGQIVGQVAHLQIYPYYYYRCPLRPTPFPSEAINQNVILFICECKSDRLYMEKLHGSSLLSLSSGRPTDSELVSVNPMDISTIHQMIVV